MNKIPFFLIIIFFMTSCGIPKSKLDNRPHFFSGDSPQLKNIVIYSFGNQQFSGLLGLIKQPDGLYYYLLDATGIKLLEVEVKSNGQFDTKNGLKKLTDSSLPGILAKSLLRIYIIEPAELPCSTHIFHRICREQLGDNALIKYARTGFFTNWQIRYETGIDSGITYTQPWVGLKITLSEVKE